MADLLLLPVLPGYRRREGRRWERASPWRAPARHKSSGPLVELPRTITTTQAYGGASPGTMLETHKEGTVIGDAVLGRVSDNSLETRLKNTRLHKSLQKTEVVNARLLCRRKGDAFYK